MEDAHAQHVDDTVRLGYDDLDDRRASIVDRGGSARGAASVVHWGLWARSDVSKQSVHLAGGAVEIRRELIDGTK
jgi:hypothetical protein